MDRSGENIRPRMDDYKGTIYDFADTSKMRGAWMIMLIITGKADKEPRQEMQEKLMVCSQIRTIHNFFPCSDCKEHFGEYITKHSPEAAFLTGNSLFSWVVGAMNEVNKRLSKQLYDEKILRAMFTGQGALACVSTCSAGSNTKVSNATFTTRYR